MSIFLQRHGTFLQQCVLVWSKTFQKSSLCFASIFQDWCFSSEGPLNFRCKQCFSFLLSRAFYWVSLVRNFYSGSGNDLFVEMSLLSFSFLHSIGSVSRKLVFAQFVDLTVLGPIVQTTVASRSILGFLLVFFLLEFFVSIYL